MKVTSTFAALARTVGVLAFGSFLATSVFAQAAAAGPAAPAAVAPATARAAAATASLDDQLKGFGFSGGIAAVFMRGGRQVANAAVDSGGILRVDFKSKERLGGILETHYLWGDILGGSDRQKTKRQEFKAAVADGRADNFSDFASGIMLGAEVGENAIRSLGLGAIISLRRIQADAGGRLTPKVAFNLGAMVLIEQNVKMLADGFRDGFALPVGQTAVRFKEDSRTGFAITFSAGF